MRLGPMLAALLVMLTASSTAHAKTEVRTFPVLAGAGAHDVYPAPDGTVWFIAQSAGKLGRLDPRIGRSDLIALGPGIEVEFVKFGKSLPHLLGWPFRVNVAKRARGPSSRRVWPPSGPN